MQKFYLNKTTSGYYQARFQDAVTGRIFATKSTHTKDYREAMSTATLWAINGIPAQHSNNKRPYIKPTANRQTMVSMADFADTLDADGIAQMIRLLQERLERLMPQQETVSIPDHDNKPCILENNKDLCNQLQAIVKREGLQPNLIQTVPVPEPIMQQDSEPAPVKEQPITVEPPAKAKVIVHKKAEQKAEPVKLLDYMRQFWDYKTSRWVVEQRALGYEPTERHCLEQYKLIDRYWAPYFGEDITANEVDTEALQEFFFYLRIERELAGATVNLAISCGSRVFGYLYQKKLIAENPFERVKRFKKNEKERSIPTESEVAALLRTEWCNEPSYLAFYLGAFCGMRAGEISGLRMCDLDEAGSMIHVRHSWNSKDGLKSTKNTDTRSVPIDSGTLQRILCYARQNPKQGELSYVFWTPVDPTTPYWPSYYRDGLYEAMQSIGISEEQRKDRNIVFHSLRHFCATILTKRGDLDTVRQILGHRTEAMTKHYSNHESEEKQRAMREALDKSRDYIFSYAKEA